MPFIHFIHTIRVLTHQKMDQIVSVPSSLWRPKLSKLQHLPCVLLSYAQFSLGILWWIWYDLMGIFQHLLGILMEVDGFSNGSDDGSRACKKPATSKHRFWQQGPKGDAPQWSEQLLVCLRSDAKINPWEVSSWSSLSMGGQNPGTLQFTSKCVCLNGCYWCSSTKFCVFLWFVWKFYIVPPESPWFKASQNSLRFHGTGSRYLHKYPRCQNIITITCSHIFATSSFLISYL